MCSMAPDCMAYQYVLHKRDVGQENCLLYLWDRLPTGVLRREEQPTGLVIARRYSDAGRPRLTVSCLV